jgi:hypothetical protein
LASVKKRRKALFFSATKIVLLLSVYSLKERGSDHATNNELNSKVDQLCGTYKSILSKNVQLVLTLASLYCGQFPYPSEVGGIDYLKVQLVSAAFNVPLMPHRVLAGLQKEEVVQSFFRFLEEVISGSVVYAIPDQIELRAR